MGAFFIKLLIVMVVASAAGGYQLFRYMKSQEPLTGQMWPLQFAPNEPPERVITLPGGSGDRAQGQDQGKNTDEDPAFDGEGQATDPDSTENQGETQSQEQDQDQQAESGPGDQNAGGQIVLDSLEIDFETTRLLFENGLATFIDARPTDEYELGHIEGALHVTPGMLNDGLFNGFEFIDAGAPIVIYCGGGDCDDSHRVAQKLQYYGYKQTHVFTGGFPEWEAAGLPTGTGPDPLADL